MKTNREAQTPDTLIGRVKLLVRERLLETVTATIAGSLLLTGVSTFNIWNIYNSYQSSISKNFELSKLSKELIYQDEFLTMSAKMAATSGDSKWEDRYNKMLPTNLETAKKMTSSLNTELRDELNKTSDANDKLAELEAQAFKLSREKQTSAALNILNSSEYESKKKILSDGTTQVFTKLEKSIQKELQTYQQQILLAIAFAGVTLPVLLVAWGLVLAAVRDYIRDRKAAEAMAVSRDELLTANDRLNQEIEARAKQQQQIQLESEQLQADIGHILDVVCSLEEGDLTVQAEVNERATGLVSDTLNRLSESLDRIVAAAVNTAKQVTNDAEELEVVAVETAHQAQVQASQVRSVQSLMDNINILTTDSRQQAIATATAVTQAKAAVVSGKEAIDDTSKGIETLQQGTDQIVRRAQLLNEFVDLAAQFSKDRKRVAALTRVLALNVSTLSSRAAIERDPDQFASLAREFETIASQVNDLAVDNERSLVSLQQRTDSVQTVTSGLAQDISEIEQLVQKFTGEVNKSRQAFDNIQTVTEEVDRMSTEVDRSSQDIVKVVTETLEAIQSISAIAQTTEAKASITKEQAQSMGDLANKLLEMVEFFKLSESQFSSIQPAKTEQKQLVQV